MAKKCLLLRLAVLFALVLSLAGCGQEKTPETEWTAGQMAGTILALQGGTEGMEQAAFGEDAFTNYLTNYYHLEPEDVTDGAIWYAGGTSALEIAVLQMESADKTSSAMEALQTYIEDRTGAFTGYLPEQAAMLEQSGVVSRGEYVALLICEGQQEAADTFNACFEGAEPPAESALPQASRPEAQPSETAAPTTEEVAEEETEKETENNSEETSEEAEPEEASEETVKPSEPAEKPEPAAEPAAEPETEPEAVPAAEPVTEPEKPWQYDRSRLLAAWRAGDWSGLHTRDQEILNTCSSVFQSVIQDGMSDYDKELAIHDWMIAWGSYDSDTLSHQQNAQPNPDHDNPYGFLIGKKGICLGYTTTFQLFMDMLGIQCISVPGRAHNDTEDHAWNMVNLGGEWYCVDVTWDDPTTYGSVSKLTAHRYFNVTSDFLRSHDHQWDESSVTEATATEYAWNPYE